MNSFERYALSIVAVILGVWMGRILVKLFGPQPLKAALLGIALVVAAFVMLKYAYVYPFSPNNNIGGYACGFGYSVLALCGLLLVGDVVRTVWKSRQRNLLRRSGRS